MTDLALLIKTRELLGRMEEHGIIASRATLSGTTNDGPDALLMTQDHRAWLIVIWAGNSFQPTLLQEEGAVPSIEMAASKLLEWRNHKQQEAGQPTPGLMILAPALSAQDMPSAVLHVAGEAVTVICQRDCKKAVTLARAVLSHQGSKLPQEVINRWRLAAVPEVGIHSPWKRKQLTRKAADSIAPLLLDYRQERCARLDLEHDSAVDSLARDLRLRIITGVAGCGKTLVLVHRAALLASHFPNARVLFISFNRPLVNDLKRRIARHPSAKRIECLTFHQWLSRLAPPSGDMISPREVVRWIERERSELGALKRLSSEWLREELQWMCDHNLVSEAYLTVERKGRGTRLNTSQRSEMLHLLTRYRVYLRQAKLVDWSEWPLSVCENPPHSLSNERFDHLLIDEAQFFAPVWLSLLRRALRTGGHLFLCADPTQGFLHRRLSWTQVGLDARHRSHRLERPYRSSRAILAFARDFYKSRLPDDDEPLNLPSPEWLETLEAGTPPIVQPAGPRQDQLARLTSELRQLRSNDIPFGHILILVGGRGFHVSDVVEHLNRDLGAGSAASMKDDGSGPDSIGVAQLMAATGLERPIVFMLGLDDLAAEEANPTLEEDERAEKRLAYTRQIYVGITRAMERLVIYTSHPALQAAFGASPV